MGREDGKKTGRKPLAWTPESEKAIDNIKAALQKHLSLFLLDPEKGFVVRTDALDYAVRAVLEQVREDGNQVPVTVWSRVLAAGEQRTWAPREKKSYTIVCALRKWAGHIGLQTVTVCNEHQVLQS